MIVWSYGTASSSARPDDTIYEIKDPITPEQRAQHAALIDRFGQDIPDKNIKFRAQESWDNWVFIRFEDQRVCLDEACLTIVIKRCGRPDCPFAAAVVGPRYKINWLRTKKWGFFISFIKRSGEYTNLMANDRFIAAYQGL